MLGFYLSNLLTNAERLEMRYTKEETDRLLALLEKHIAEAPEFSRSDNIAIHEMLQAWRGWVSLGRGAKWIITTLGLIAAAIASWGVFASSIKDWIKS